MVCNSINPLGLQIDAKHLDQLVLIVIQHNWIEQASEGKVRICFATSKAILTEAFDRLLRAEKLF